jgi:hypothetical protein
MTDAESYYALEPGCVIRRILPPFKPERLEMFRTLPAESRAKFEPDGPAAMLLEWGHCGLRISMTSIRLAHTFSIVADRVLNDHHWKWEGDYALLSQKLEGDIVLRAGASEAEYFDGLNQLAEELWPGENVRLKPVEVRRQVKVLNGKWNFKPVDSYAESRCRIEFYMHELDPDRQRVGERTATLPNFAASLSRYSGMQIFIEADDAPDKITWYENSLVHPTAEKRRIRYDPPLVIQHVQDQTGLTLSTQFRNVRRVLIEAF